MGMALTLRRAGPGARTSHPPGAVGQPWLTTTGGIAGIVVVWELAARFYLADLYALAAPSAIVERIVTERDLYWRATMVTLNEAFWGFAIGNLIAIALAAFVVVVPRTERVTQALALVVFCLPLVATGPILRVLFGPGIGPQITLAALAVYYTTFIPMVVGLRAVPTAWLDLVRTYGRGRLTALWAVRARASIPYLVAGLQIAAPAAFLGAMVGEFTGAERGLGVLSIQTMRSLDVVGTWSVAVVATVIAIAAYMLAGWIGNRASAGKPPVLLASAPAGSAGKDTTTRDGAVAFGLAALLIVVLWHGLMAAFDLPRFFAKRPMDVIDYLFLAGNAADHRAVLFSALGETVFVTVPGYFLGLVMGAGCAALFCLFPALARISTPIAIALRSIPIVATAPLLVMAFGRGFAGTVIIVAVMIFFPTLVACAHGLRQAPGQIIDVFDSYSAGRWKTLLKARVPAMVPALFAAARMSVPAAVLAATVAEWLATGTGIGNLMALTASTSDYGMLWSAVVLLTLVSVAGYVLVSLVERRALERFAPEQVAR